MDVVLYEMRPSRMTEAHLTDGLAELVCSNSFRSDDVGNAVGLLKEEMRRVGGRSSPRVRGRRCRREERSRSTVRCSLRSSGS